MRLEAYNYIQRKMELKRIRKIAIHKLILKDRILKAIAKIGLKINDNDGIFKTFMKHKQNIKKYL